MKKTAIIAMSLGLVAIFAMGAYAGPWGHRGYGMGQGYGMMGPGSGMGPGGGRQLSAEDQEKFAQARAAFLKDTLETRKQLSAKSMELRTLTAQSGYDQEQAKGLANEITDLQAQLQKKRNEHMSQFGGGYGRGWGKGGYGARGGYGPGNCPGFGGRGGYGPRAGGSGGYCWQ